ncbi:zinc ribbon domain-containing protein [Arcobacter sp. LA11]|uniref:zinc ribbon domain-containing protein n=1 Tax=Arcobacter sp. LA11 TaxID=1898176 RepID=UPI0009F85A40|nr:zinc ribbon domain-containing protein [Arcobacter sp. LA11]
MIKQYIKDFYSTNFTFKGKEKLSKLTIFFVIILDIFIFITLGLGIDFQVKVLNNPSVVYPYQCRNVVDSNKLDDFNRYFYTYQNNNMKYQSIKNDQMDNRCDEILHTKLKAVQKEHKIKDLRKREKELNKDLNNITAELNYLRANYNTVLFEKISSQSSDKSIVKDNISSENIKTKYDSYVKQNEKIKKQKEALYKSFKESKSVKEFISFVKKNKSEIKKDLKELQKSYQLKKDLVTLAFLLPLLFLSFYMMRKYLYKEKYTLYVMFKNIFVVILIPTFFSLISLIYTFLPKVFIEKLLKFFYELEVPFIVYYIAIAIFVVIFGYIIVKLQNKYRNDINKFKSNSISKTESYNRSICNVCTNKVNYETMNFCPCCKNELRVDCPSCNKKTIKGLNFCIKCSSEL